MSATATASIAAAGLTDDAAAERLRFLRIDAGDEEALAVVHSAVEAQGGVEGFVEEFYAHLRDFPVPARLLEDPQRFARLRAAQARYFQRLTAGRYDAAYLRERSQVGAAHQRAGLGPVWYMGAYRHYLSLMLPRLREALGADPAGQERALEALLKVVWLDMGLAVEAYIAAEARQVRRHEAKLAALGEIAVMLTASLQPREVLATILRHGCALAEARGAAIALHDAAHGRCDDWVAHGLSPAFIDALAFAAGDLGLAEPPSDGVAMLPLGGTKGRAGRFSAVAEGDGVRAVLRLALPSRGQSQGTLLFFRACAADPAEDDLAALQTFARLAGHAIANGRSFARAREEAGTDALTGLGNRRGFDERLAAELQRAERYGTPAVLALFDIDHFKAINDRHGHPAGDAVLQQLARVLRTHVRRVDHVARVGGEEFAVLLSHITPAMGVQVIDRMREAIARVPFALPDGTALAVTVSAGVACVPHCATAPAALVARADQALYAAKRAGRDRVCYAGSPDPQEAEPPAAPPVATVPPQTRAPS